MRSSSTAAVGMIWSYWACGRFVVRNRKLLVIILVQDWTERCLRFPGKHRRKRLRYRT